MFSRVETCLKASVMILLSTVLLHPVHAQRITPDVSPQEFGDVQSQERSDRLIFPDQIDPPDINQQEEIHNQGKVEQLMADSAAMRVEFEEKISQLRSDSRAMNQQYKNQIQQLQKKIDALREEMESLRTRVQSGASETEKSPGSQQKQASAQEASKPSSSSSESDRPSASPEMKLNPNNASVSDLASIPGLSRRLAERIEWYRREVSPFQSREDLRRVPGVDRQRYEKISPYFHEGPY